MIHLHLLNIMMKIIVSHSYGNHLHCFAYAEVATGIDFINVSIILQLGKHSKLM